MTRYGYNTQKQPPAPFVLVTLRNPANGAEGRDLPAQLDPGADRTVVPLAVVQALALPVAGQTAVAGLGGVPAPAALYGSEVRIHGLVWQAARVIAHPGEPWVLLGRDVLNAHRLLLDGPNLVLEIG